MKPWYEQPYVTLWQEDRCVPDRETLQEAWERLFDEDGRRFKVEDVDSFKCIGYHDFGDTMWDLYPGNRVVVKGCDGAEIRQLQPEREVAPEPAPVPEPVKRFFVIGVESGECCDATFSIEEKCFTDENLADVYAAVKNKAAAKAKGDDKRKYTVWPVEAS